MSKEKSPINSGQEYVNFMMRLMRDVRNGEVSPQAASAAVKAGDSAIKMMEMQLRLVPSSGQKTDLLLESAEIVDVPEPPETAESAVLSNLVVVPPTEIPPIDLDSPEEKFEWPNTNSTRDSIEDAVKESGLARTVFWRKLDVVAHRMSDWVLELNPSLIGKPLRIVMKTIETALND